MRMFILQPDQFHILSNLYIISYAHIGLDIDLNRKKLLCFVAPNVEVVTLKYETYHIQLKLLQDEIDYNITLQLTI